MASVATPGSEKNSNKNTQIITRNAIKRKGNNVQEIQRETKNEKGDAKIRQKEILNTELNKLRTIIGDRDRIIDQLKQERDQLQKENDSLKKILKDVDIPCTDQSIIVAGKRKHRALPQTPTPLPPSQSPVLVPCLRAKTTTPQRPKLDKNVSENTNHTII